jgi:hypothetical protein
MRGVEFKDQTRVLGKPTSMADEHCNSLPVKITENGEYPSVESVWELSEDELLEVIESGRIRVGILGSSMPPIYLQVETI